MTVPVISNRDCQDLYDDFGATILSLMICAGEEGKDACQGDSGGPVVHNVGGNYELVGTVSWGVGCGRDDAVGVYGRATHPTVQSWWMSVVGEPSCDRMPVFG